MAVHQGINRLDLSRVADAALTVAGFAMCTAVLDLSKAQAEFQDPADGGTGRDATIEIIGDAANNAINEEQLAALI